jgi:tRNA(His) 5'-end guanylyltransferase
MPVNDDLGTRMKEYYENVYRFGLTRRTPVAIRIDGKAFHTFTKGFQKPFDEVLMTTMQRTMKYLCENIQGCKIGYTQSDEITLIITDYDTLTTDAWFGYNLQKMCSIAASMATMAFNKFFEDEVDNWGNRTFGLWWYEGGCDPEVTPIKQEEIALAEIYQKAIDKGAMFDARVFNIPKEEVTNLVYWRQLDAIRNSIQMVGQAYFSHSELQNKSCKDIQDMLALGRGIDWSYYPTACKRGTCCIKTVNGWHIDKEIPVFKDEYRAYIDDLIYIEGE